jgi:hypothetical protein
MTDRDLRRIYAALQQERRAAGGAPRVSLDSMLAAVEGHGSEEERIATIDEALAHPESARELELFRAVAANRRRPSRGVPWRAMPLFVAAAAALAIVVVPTARDVLREKSPTILRDVSPEAVLIDPPEEPAPEASRIFRWRGVGSARAYALEILTASGTVVFTTRTTDTTLALPPDVSLAPGVEHRWWVTSELSDGTQRPSAFRRLMVRAPR